jgi:ATP/ADP translocase
MKRQRTDSSIHAAAFGAAALIASQVAGKATRDAFFLSQFAVTALPAMVIVASLLSVAAGFVTPRLLNTRTSKRQLSLAFVGSAVLLFAEWWISTWNPAMAAVLIYLHMTILGSVLISGFWSLLDDRYDARSARKQFGKIVGASTLGGIVGGVLAGRVGSSAGVASMLPVLAFLHIVCAFMATSLASQQKTGSKRTAKRESGSGLTVLRTVPYVRNVALVILSSTMGAGLLDFVFKARVSAAYPAGEGLVEFFALFYTAVGVATFLVQLILSRVAVEKLGIAGTVSSLPASLAIGSIGALVLPGVPAASAMRGSEAMVRSSLFKSGYEMLYAAVPRRERQATKAILDIGVDRMGDLLGALLLGGISWAISPNSTTIMLSSAAVLGIVGFIISRRLRVGYVQALENSLVSRSMSAVHLPNMPAIGASIIMTLRNLAVGQESQPKPVVEKPVSRDPVIQRIQDLRSTDPEIIRSRLRQPLEPVLASAVIELLAWDEVSADAIGALIMMGPRISGQLVDALVDPDQEFAIRRRIPRVLGTFDSQRVVDGLIEGLFDSRFEVRYHSGHALAQIKSRNPLTEIRQRSITSAVERELEVSPEVWRNYRVIDSTRQEPTETITIDHIFRLLALVHASEPLQLAHRALKSRDEQLRRTSLEYLENVLPDPVWQRILPLFEEGAPIAIG